MSSTIATATTRLTRPATVSTAHKDQMSSPVRWLDNQYVHLALAEMPPYVNAVRQFFFRHSVQQIGENKRFEIKTPYGLEYLMPASIGHIRGLKYISSRPGNPEIDLDRSQSRIEIRNDITVQPIFIVEGNVITPSKTAVCTMVALQEWVKQVNPDRLKIGIFGGGNVARYHLTTIHKIFGDRVVNVVCASQRDSAQNMVRDLDRDFPCSVGTRAQILKDCNVIISATSAQEEVVDASILQRANESIFLAGIGFRDIAPAIFEQVPQIISDDPVNYTGAPSYTLAQALTRMVDKNLTGLSEIVQGQEKIQPNRITLFMPYGNAAVDLAVCIEMLKIEVNYLNVGLGKVSRPDVDSIEYSI